MTDILDAFDEVNVKKKLSYCGGHLIRHFVFFNSKRPRDIHAHLTSIHAHLTSIKLPSCDDHLGILSDLVAERYIPSFKQSQCKIHLCGDLLGGPIGFGKTS